MEKILDSLSFQEDNILTLADFGDHKKATKKAIQRAVRKAVRKGSHARTLLLLITGHALLYDGKAAIRAAAAGNQQKGPLDMKVTVFQDTCMAGAFFKAAKMESETRGPIVVFGACGEDKITRDGDLIHDVVQPIQAIVVNL